MSAVHMLCIFTGCFIYLDIVTYLVFHHNAVNMKNVLRLLEAQAKLNFDAKLYFSCHVAMCIYAFQEGILPGKYGRLKN
jgi:hypothetical protein